MSPFWNGRAPSGMDTPLAPGFWAVEPHLADGDLGAKFEEILVVTAHEVFWLDEDLPHVRQQLARPTRGPTAEASHPQANGA